MKASSYDQIAEHLRAGGEVLLAVTQGDKFEHTTAYSAEEFRRAGRDGRSGGMLPVDEYELVPLPESEPPVDPATLERKHHNRVSNLQRKVRHARIARDKSLAAHKVTLAKVAQLEANERELLDQIQRLAAERDVLSDRFAPTEGRATDAANPNPSTRVIHLCDADADDVFVATHLPVGTLWRRTHPERTWLHHPENVEWQEGYQPVPFEPGGENLVRVYERRPGDEHPPLFSKAEAEAQGYTVDTTTYPWTGYKGSRFSPSVVIAVHTPAVER